MTHAILAHVVVADGRSDTEQRKLHDTKGSQSLGKILWLLHLSDEGWVQDLQKKRSAFFPTPATGHIRT